jgi:hypothetical protein
MECVVTTNCRNRYLRHADTGGKFAADIFHIGGAPGMAIIFAILFVKIQMTQGPGEDDS